MGVGLTVMLYVRGVPVQPFALGVIVTVAVPATGLYEGIDVTPVRSDKPTDVPPVTSKTTPTGEPDNVMTGVATPSQ